MVSDSAIPAAAPPAPLPPPPSAPPPPPAETFAVTLPGAAASGGTVATAPDRAAAPAGDALPSNHPVRMALLLPLRSETLGEAAAAVRDGFMAAWERDRDNVTVTVAETGDVAQDVLSAYATAEEQNDIVVGPLARSAVGTVAASALVQKPTIVLNSPEGHGAAGAAPLPPKMLAMGLSIEDEARQAARWAASEHPHSSALIVTTGTPWQHRIASAFAAQWERFGMPSRTVELSAPNGYLSDPELAQLRARIHADPPGLLFAALGADQARQLRNALLNALPDPNATTTSPDDGNGADGAPAPLNGAPAPANALPIYGTSSLNPGGGSNSPTQELDGVRLLDLPWEVQRDHPAVMVYPRPLPAAERKPGAADMERLYALGIDAYRVAREIARHTSSRFHLDGVTGQLTVVFGDGEAAFERIEQPAIYRNGVAQPVAP